MSRPETFLNLNQPETQPEPQNGGKEETKKSWLKKAWEKTRSLTGKADKNDTYITTLDLQGHNKAFLDKADRLANFWDHAKAWASSQIELNEKENSPLSLNLNETSAQLTAEAQSTRAETTRQAQTIAEQREELREIGDEWENPYKEQRADGTEEAIADEPAPAVEEKETKQKTPMEKVAELIVRTAPDVQSIVGKGRGWNKIVEALNTGNFKRADGKKDLALLEQTAAVIDKVSKGAKWGENDSQLLQEVGQDLTLEIKEEKYFSNLEREQAGKEAQAQKEAREQQTLKLKETCVNFGAFLKTAQKDMDLNFKNPKLSENFIDGSFDDEDLKEALRVITLIRGRIELRGQANKILRDAEQLFGEELKKEVIIMPKKATRKKRIPAPTARAA